MEVRANIAVYSGDYKNIQRTTGEVISGALLNVTRSAAEGSIEGVEFTGALVPFDGLTLKRHYSYIQSEYTSVTDASAGAILAGSPFPYTPESKFSLGATYETELSAWHAGAERLLCAAVGILDRPDQRLVRPLHSRLRHAQLVRRSQGRRRLARGSLRCSRPTSPTTSTQPARPTSTTQPFGIATYTYGEPQMYGVRLRYRFGSVSVARDSIDLTSGAGTPPARRPGSAACRLGSRSCMPRSTCTTARSACSSRCGSSIAALSPGADRHADVVADVPAHPVRRAGGQPCRSPAADQGSAARLRRRRDADDELHELRARPTGRC